MTEVRFHPAAGDEVEEAYRFYREHNPSAASRFATEIGRALDSIRQSPLLSPPDAKQTRRFILRGFPFAIVYRIGLHAKSSTRPVIETVANRTTNIVTIIAVAHHSRRPGYWFDR